MTIHLAEASVRAIGVIGTGVMGRGIIQWAAQCGATVFAHDARVGAAAEAVASVGDMLARSVSRGRLSEAERGAMLRRIHVAETIADLSAADLVIEAIVEDLHAKRQLFSALEKIVGEDAILCTNTSSLSVTACARDCAHPGRVAGLHFFNPVPLMKVVEVIRGERTGSDVIDRLVGFIRGGDHHPLVCGDTPGFVVNHAGRGLSTEALRIVQEGVAAPVDVDRVMREYGGLPMGPFELFDLTGLDVSSRVLREIYDGFFQDPRYRPSPLVYRRVDAKLYGRKVNEGFYPYANGKKIEPAEVSAPPPSAARAYVDGPDIAREIFARGGLALVADPAGADIILICPFGDDATTAALSAGFDPRKTVAIDTLLPERLGEGGRATLMGTPVTAGEKIEAIHAALAGAGLRVTRIADSPGFIAQRVFANIVNTACEIAQQRLAAPADIDAGVRFGLGYPDGPLAMGDRIGRRRILHILERLQNITGDPRYRPSLWLRRRVQLDISFTTPE
jgi:3-hydroxybutyryl-CoA dehydrogenase